MIDWSEVTENDEVIRLIKQMEEIQKKIFELEKYALINYELEKLKE